MSAVKHKKVQHYDLQGHAHELTFSCYKNLPFLESDRACEYCAVSLQRARTLYPFDLWAYVIMPNHVHLLMYPTSETYAITKILQAVKQGISRRYLSYCKKQAPQLLHPLTTKRDNTAHRFWQRGGGYDRNMTSVPVIRHAVDYIHNNPVRAGLVDDPGMWKWSSYREWLESGQGPIPIQRETFPMM